MKTRKKALALALAIALPATLALTACGSDDNGSGPVEPEGNELTVWTWDPNFNIYAMQEAEKVYQKDNPDFKLNIVETPWEDVQTKLTTLAQSQAYDELPDIFLMQNNAFQKNVLNYGDIFQDLTESGIKFDDFPAGVTAYSVIDSKNYGVPFDAGTAIGAYRTDLLQEAGLTLDDFTDIDYTKFIELGKQVKEKTGKPILSGQAGSSDMIMMMLQSAGASIFNDAGEPIIGDSPELLEAINVYNQMVKEGLFLEVNSWDEYIGTLVNGEVAGTINGVWIVGSMQTAADQSGKWGVTNLPKLSGADATNYSANGGSSWAVSSTADVGLAQDFLAKTFGGSNELYDTILPKAGAVANWIPAGNSDVYGQPQEFFGGQPIYQDVVKFGASVPKNNTGAYYYEGRDAVSAAITKIAGGADPATALAEAQKTVEFAMN